MLTVLVQMRPHQLKAAWDEAYKHGKEWRNLFQEGAARLSAPLQQSFMQLIGRHSKTV